MDNAAHHDEAVYDAASRTLTTLDVGLNSLLALDAEMLALFAAELGHGADAQEFAALAERTRLHIRSELWDDRRGLFANRLRSGALRAQRRADELLTRWYRARRPQRRPSSSSRIWTPPATFGGAFVIPGTARDDPAFADNTYWRGRIWPPLNFWVWQGLRRAGLQGRADRLAEASFALFDRVWRERRLCPENYNATTGEPLDQPDTGGILHLGRAAAADGCCADQRCLALARLGADQTEPMRRSGRSASPVGLATVTRADGWLTLLRGKGGFAAHDAGARDKPAAVTGPDCIRGARGHGGRHAIAARPGRCPHRCRAPRWSPA